MGFRGGREASQRLSVHSGGLAGPGRVLGPGEAVSSETRAGSLMCRKLAEGGLSRCPWLSLGGPGHDHEHLEPGGAAPPGRRDPKALCPLLSRPRAAQAGDPLQPPLAAWSRPACPAPAGTWHFPGGWELAACLPHCCPGRAAPGAWHTECEVHSSPWGDGNDRPGSASRQKGTLAPSLKGSVTLGKSFRLWSVDGADHSLCSPGCESIGPHRPAPAMPCAGAESVLATRGLLAGRPVSGTL